MSKNMALSHEVAAQFSWIIWIFTLLLSETWGKKSQSSKYTVYTGIRFNSCLRSLP